MPRAPRSSSTTPRSPDSSMAGCRRASLRRVAEHHPQRLAGGQRIDPRGQLGIVGPYGARADQHGVRDGPKSVHVATRRFTRDPSTRSVGSRDSPVERCRQLQDDPGTAGLPVLEIGGELVGHLGCTDPDGHLHPRRPQRRHPSSRHMVIGIEHADDHPGHAGVDDGPHAGRGAAGVRAGLEGGVERRALCASPLHGAAQRHHLGVVSARRLGRSLKRLGRVVAAHHDATHPRVGRGGAPNAGGQRHGAQHVLLVAGQRAVHGLPILPAVTRIALKTSREPRPCPAQRCGWPPPPPRGGRARRWPNQPPARSPPLGPPPRPFAR